MIVLVGVIPLTAIAMLDSDGRVGNLVTAGLFALGGALVIGLVYVSGPRHVVVSNEVIRAISVFRTKEIRWTELRSVSSPWYDYANATVVWRSDNGKVVTRRNYYGFYKLLSEIHERAPQAELHRLC